MTARVALKSMKTLWDHFNKILNKPACLILILVLFFGFKIWLAEAIPLRANQLAKADGLLFQKIAQNIILGDWLGEYNRYILTKGPGYPLWIAFVWLLSVPLRFANEILYFLSVAIFFRLLSLLKVLNIFSVLGVILLLFNPATLNNWYWGSFMRQNIYFSLCAISIFSLFISYFNICYTKKVPIHWLLLSGISLGYAWITREESIWTIPIFIGVFTISLFIGKLKLKAILQKLSMLLIPLLLVLAIVTAVSCLNYKYYKFYGVSELKSKEFTEAWNAVVGVQHGAWQQYRPLHSRLLKEINKHSDSMKEIEKYLRKTNDSGVEIPHAWHGATAHWSFRHAVAKAGYYKKDFNQTKEYYIRLAQEIDVACEKGDLECKGPLFGMVHWHDSYDQQIVPTFVAVVQSLVQFRNYEIAFRDENIRGSRGYNKRIESLAHRAGGYPMRSDEAELYPSYQIKLLAYKSSVLQNIILTYRKYSAWLFLFSLGVLSFYFIKVTDRTPVKQTIALIVLSSLGSMLTIILINVLLAITAYNSYVRPLMTATPYYLVIIATLFVVLPKTLVEIKRIYIN